MLVRYIEPIVYLVGVAILGLAHSSLKAAVSGPVFFAVAIVYLLALRLCGRFLVKKVTAHVAEQDRNV